MYYGVLYMEMGPRCVAAEGWREMVVGLARDGVAWSVAFVHKKYRQMAEYSDQEG